MSNDLIVSQETVSALDKAAADGLLAQSEVSQFKRTYMVAMAVKRLQDILTPKALEPIMHLQNSAIGFRTDQPNGYDAGVVKDALIEATMKGVFPVGNQFNIIAGRCYITKEGFYKKLRDIPNFTWIETPHIPKMLGENGAVIVMSLEWTLNGKKESKDLELAIRVNRGMGADAIIGKATRKARAWLFTAVSGQDCGDGDVDSAADKAEVIDADEAVVKQGESPIEQMPEQPKVQPELKM